MCYLIAKDVDKVVFVALRTTHGKHLSEYLLRSGWRTKPHSHCRINYENW